ncbi:MAG: PLDc N-terminal domain-containing protein [Chthoniobacter sp.]
MAWLAFLVPLAHALGALSAFRAVMDVRTPQGAIAWAFALLTVPYLAVPAYWIFGRRKFRGYATNWRVELTRTTGAPREFLNRVIAQDLLVLPERHHPLLVERLARLPFTKGNDAELLIDGAATFDSLFAGLDRARSYLLVQFFIIHDDEIGRELKTRLIACVQRGVRCHVLYDEVGSRLPRAYEGELRAAGVDIRPFHSTKGFANRLQLNFRNHRKIVVIDGREAWGGWPQRGR